MTSKEYVEGKERKKVIDDLIKLANIPEEEYSKMSFKEKQAVFRAKSKLCNVFHRGGTYIKKKEVK